MTLTETNLLILFIIIYLTLGQIAISQQQQQQAPVGEAPQQTPPTKLARQILIPNLPAKHYQFWLKNHPLAFKEFRESLCPRAKELSSPSIDQNAFKAAHFNLSIEDPRYLNDLEYGKSVLAEICSHIDDVTKSCWGYETSCQIIYLMPECHGTHLGQAKSELDQKVGWFNQGDFGYILNRRKEMAKFCSPDRHSNHSIVSSLECSKSFKTCRGDNLMIKLSPSGNQLEPLQVGGWNCDLQKKRIEEELKLRQVDSYDWFDALKNYDLILGKSPQDLCEVTIQKPVILMKLNSLDNLYKFMSNFINLYATIHLNNRFTEDNQIIIWDNNKSPMKRSNYDLLWRAFSKNSVITMGSEFRGKSVCFKKFITTLSPEKQDELFYERPLVSGCSGTGLFDAFSKHVLHKLNIPQVFDLKRFGSNFVHIILLVSSPAKRLHRRILNEYNLIQKLRQELGTKHYSIEPIEADSLGFKQMVLIARNTDLLVGMHGTSLTYSLFLPDWASLFEVYNCGDQKYHDLAKLKGVSYYTLSDKDKFVKKLPTDKPEEFKRLQEAKLAEHEMFSNYEIDENEFVSVVKKATEQVKKRRAKHFPETSIPTASEQGVKREVNPHPQPSPSQPPSTKITYTDEEKPTTIRPEVQEVSTTTSSLSTPTGPTIAPSPIPSSTASTSPEKKHEEL